MLKRVTLVLDTTDPKSWTDHNVENLGDFLMSKFSVFPDTGRIYHKTVAQENDITPSGHDEAELEKFQQLEGPFFVIVYPGWVALPYILAIGIGVAAYLMMPKPVTPPAAPLLRNTQAASPNNELSDRTNSARPDGRIPDIFGTVRSTPDLIAAPYKIFENNKEVEYAYMCVGRGAYAINANDIRDGENRCINIQGVSIEVYGPYTSPNDGDPELTIGTPINKRVATIRRINGVNGQVLRPPNTVSITGDADIQFVPPNVIRAESSSAISFDQYFIDGDVLVVTDATLASGGTLTDKRWCYSNQDNTGFSFDILTPTAPPEFTAPSTISISMTSYYPFEGGFINDTIVAADYDVTAVTVTDNGDGTYRCHVTLDDPNSVVPVGIVANWWSVDFDSSSMNYHYFVTEIPNPSSGFDLNGTYDVLSVTSKEMALDDPASVAADWGTLPEAGTPSISPTLEASGEKWVGAFTLEDPLLDEVICNFVAPNGLYTDDGTTQTAVNISIQVKLIPVDTDDEPIGDPEYFSINIAGSSFVRETIGKTLVCRPTFTGRCTVQARRVTSSDTEFSGQVVDEVRWRDVYSSSPVDFANFGNVTTVHSRIFATASALAVKERKLNMIVTRKIPTRISGSTFTESLTATNNAAEIFSAVCLDTYIGARGYPELDFDNIYDTVAAIETYFGTDLVTQFNYTFDKDNLSFEETANIVAQAIHCVPFRRGNIIKLNFEAATEISTILFNHRNKVPKSERRLVSFGQLDDNDGLEYKYVNPVDDSIISLFLPPSYAATKPKKVESIGIRDHLQAYFHAWRIWNKIRYQNTSVEFEATQEAELLIKNDRILVTDGTRPYTQDGEVIDVDTLELTLSQNVDLTVYPSYAIHLQHTDGVAEAIAITAGSATNKVILDEAPRLTLVTDTDKVRTTYIIVGSLETTQMAFLVSSREPAERMTSAVKAVNYDARYYANDTDFITEDIDEEGYGDSGGYTPGTGTGFLVLPGTPELSGEITGGNSPQLVWSSVSTGTYPLAGFRLYRNGVLYQTFDDDAIGYVDSDLDDGTYEYYLVAFDDHGNLSLPSETIPFTIGAEAIRTTSDPGYAQLVPVDAISFFTITGWAYLPDASTNCMLFCVTRGTSSVAFSAEAIGDNNITFKLGSHTVTPSEAPDAERWFFFALTKSNSSVDIYWAYNEDISFPSGSRHIGDESSFGGTAPTRASAGIYRDEGGNEAQSGAAVTFIRQWKAALSSSELLQEKYYETPQRTSNLWSSNPLQDNTDISDDSGNGRTATMVGPPDNFTPGPHPTPPI